MDFLTSQTHLHITTWVVAIVIFLIAALMGKQSKGLHMTLRLFYILIIITGGALFIKGMDYGMGMLYGFKFIGGILVIGMMEMVLVRQKKNKPTGMFWILFAVFLLITLFLGFKLPMGQNFLA
ncbi:YisL family protein [Lysinibacillus sp. NPDC056959]|uniref:YisL family protein n=1 Tax=Lysinibacillus sp. NPDC056959 TaxID=3345981 RepID=UPI00363074A8